jgi:hypothetical protein
MSKENRLILSHFACDSSVTVDIKSFAKVQRSVTMCAKIARDFLVIQEFNI